MGDLSWCANEPFGARIDINLSRSLSGSEVAQLRALFDEYGLLVFAGQNLGNERQKEICAWFGPVIDEARANFVDPDPAVGGLGRKELAFHSDNACSELPLEGISLFALDVDEGKTATRFVDAMAAADRLPTALREQLAGLSALHLWPSMASSSERSRGSAETPEDWPGAVHPVLLSHRPSGREILFLSAGQTERIVDLSPADGEALIRQAFACLYDDRFIFEHVWTNGDLVIWDNLSFQHGRRELAPGTRRRLRRVAMGAPDYAKNAPAEFRAFYKDLSNV